MEGLSYDELAVYDRLFQKGLLEEFEDVLVEQEESAMVSLLTKVSYSTDEAKVLSRMILKILDE